MLLLNFGVMRRFCRCQEHSGGGGHFLSADSRSNSCSAEVAHQLYCYIFRKKVNKCLNKCWILKKNAVTITVSSLVDSLNQTVSSAQGDVCLTLENTRQDSTFSFLILIDPETRQKMIASENILICRIVFQVLQVYSKPNIRLIMIYFQTLILTELR